MTELDDFWWWFGSGSGSRNVLLYMVADMSFCRGHFYLKLFPRKMHARTSVNSQTTKASRTPVYTRRGAHFDIRLAFCLILSTFRISPTESRWEQQARNSGRDRTLKVDRRENMTSSCCRRNKTIDNPAAVSMMYMMTSVNEWPLNGKIPSTDVDTSLWSDVDGTASTHHNATAW